MEIEKSIQKIVDITFKDAQGKVVLAQKPNLPLVVAGVATLLQKFINYKVLSDGLNLISFGALLTWACLEAFEGVNYFRKALGFFTIILTILARV